LLRQHLCGAETLLRSHLYIATNKTRPAVEYSQLFAQCQRQLPRELRLRVWFDFSALTTPAQQIVRNLKLATDLSLGLRSTRRVRQKENIFFYSVEVSGKLTKQLKQLRLRQPRFCLPIVPGNLKPFADCAQNDFKRFRVAFFSQGRVNIPAIIWMAVDSLAN